MKILISWCRSCKSVVAAGSGKAISHQHPNGSASTDIKVAEVEPKKSMNEFPSVQGWLDYLKETHPQE